jgi:hypothetical protein
VSRADRRIARFRHNVSTSIAGLVAFLGAIPLATAGFDSSTEGTPWWAYPLLLILVFPLAAMVWGWRAGTDADAEGVVARPFGVGGKSISWGEIVGIVPQNRRVYAILGDDRAVPLPAVSRDDLSRLVAAGGQKLDTTSS